MGETSDPVKNIHSRLNELWVLEFSTSEWHRMRENWTQFTPLLAILPCGYIGKADFSKECYQGLWSSCSKKEKISEKTMLYKASLHLFWAADFKIMLHC